MPKSGLPRGMQVISQGVIRVDPAMDGKGRLNEDRACLRCGYALRGVAFRGNCPECGTPVFRSCFGDLIEYSDPGYVMALHRGTTLLLVGEGCSIAGFVVREVATFLEDGTTPTALSVAGVIYLCGGFVHLASQLGVVAGYWMFSREDPAQMTMNRAQWARLLLRVVVVASAALNVSTLAVSIGPMNGWLARSVGLAWGLAVCLEFMAAMVYIRWLAGRIPDKPAHERAGMLAWLGPVLLVLSVGLIFINSYFVMMAGLVILMLTGMYLLLIVKLRRALAGVREEQGTLGVRVMRDVSRPMS